MVLAALDLVRLPAQEGRNVELVLVAGVMHRALSVTLLGLRRGLPAVLG